MIKEQDLEGIPGEDFLMLGLFIFLCFVTPKHNMFTWIFNYHSFNINC